MAAAAAAVAVGSDSGGHGGILSGGQLPQQARVHHQRKKTIAWQDAVRIAYQIAAALAYLHDCMPAVVHRDIKPGEGGVKALTLMSREGFTTRSSMYFATRDYRYFMLFQYYCRIAGPKAFACTLLICLASLLLHGVFHQTGNILLDDHMNAKLADVGLAVVVPPSTPQHSMAHINGAAGHPHHLLHLPHGSASSAAAAAAAAHHQHTGRPSCLPASSSGAQAHGRHAAASSAAAVAAVSASSLSSAVMSCVDVEGTDDYLDPLYAQVQWAPPRLPAWPFYTVSASHTTINDLLILSTPPSNTLP